MHRILSARNPSLLLCLATWLIVAASFGRSACAQDDDLLLAPVPQPVQEFDIPAESIDQWIFGGMMTSDAGRTKFNSLLTLRIEEIERFCELSDAQKRKLHLAGHGEIQQFFDRVDAIKWRFAHTKHDQNGINAVFQE